MVRNIPSWRGDIQKSLPIQNPLQWKATNHNSFSKTNKYPKLVLIIANPEKSAIICYCSWFVCIKLYYICKQDPANLKNDIICLKTRISAHNQQSHNDRPQQKGFPLLGQQFGSTQRLLGAKQHLPEFTPATNSSAQLITDRNKKLNCTEGLPTAEEMDYPTLISLSSVMRWCAEGNHGSPSRHGVAPEERRVFVLILETLGNFHNIINKKINIFS